MTFRSRFVASLFLLPILGLFGGCGGGGSTQTGPPVSQPTTTTLNASPTTATQGANVVLTATVTSSGGTPVGSVSFLDGATSLGTASLSGGTASLTVSSLAVGSHSITASYGGSSGTFLTSASTAVAVTINAPAVATTTVVSASPNPAPAGASVTLTATTTATSGTATGTVTFFDGATSVGTGALNGSGVATLSVSTLAIGSHSITASYAGAGSFTASTSAAVPLVIAAITTTTSLTALPNPATVGANVVLTSTTAAASGTATGTVTFFDGATSLGTGTLNGSGVAALTVSTLSGGSHSLTASYAASGNFGASTSAAVTVLINQTTTTTVSASPNPAAQGASVVLTATTTATSGTPGGSVTFYDGVTSLGSGTLVSGVATLSSSSLSVGSHNITASYTATSGFLASTSAAVTLVINASAATTTALSASPNPASQGVNVVLNASTTAASGTPAGTITFYDGVTSLGTASLSGGTASLTVSTLALGAHSVTASFGGGSGFAASTSTAVTVNITASVSAHSTYSFTTANQTIMGFGGAEAFYQNYLSNHPNATQIYTALFDPVNGLGLNFLRLQNNYFAVGTGSTTTSNFDPDAARIVQGANTSAGSAGPVSVMLASWTPPAAIKSNNSTIGGTLKMVSGAYDYADFATYWHDSVVAYTALGVTPNYISIQNEPDFTASYVSCRFNPTEAIFQGASYAGYDKALDAVYKAVQALPTPPKLIGPESFSTVNLLSFASALETGTTQTETYALAHHLYNVSSGSPNPDAGLSALQNLATQYPTQLKFETEYFTSPGFLNAWNIHNALAVGNDNAYIYWGLAWPSTLSGGQATDQQGLLYIDNPFVSQSTWAFTKGWAYNDAYYAMKHFSYFIRPGYVRYNASVDNADERVSVYQSPDKKTTVIVAMNVSTTATDTMSLDLSGVTYTGSTMYRSTFSAPIATGERWANLGAVTPSSITLGPQAVVTIVLSN